MALGDPAHARRFDQFVDRARRHALHIGFLDDGGERFLGRATWLQKRWEVAASP
jgi:hypothetical protein